MTKNICLALLLMGMHCVAGARPESFEVAVQPKIEGGCFSYWGDEGRDWATFLIGKDTLARLAEPPDAAHMDAWGCTHIRDTEGGSIGLIFELLESGQLVVIDDAANAPVAHISSPLKVRFAVVDENGEHGETESADSS